MQGKTTIPLVQRIAEVRHWCSCTELHHVVLRKRNLWQQRPVSAQRDLRRRNKAGLLVFLNVRVGDRRRVLQVKASNSMPMFPLASLRLFVGFNTVSNANLAFGARPGNIIAAFVRDQPGCRCRYEGVRTEHQQSSALERAGNAHENTIRHVDSNFLRLATVAKAPVTQT